MSNLLLSATVPQPLAQQSGRIHMANLQVLLQLMGCSSEHCVPKAGRVGR